MNKILYKTAILVVFAASMVSCKKGFLEVIPKGSAVARNVKDYELLMNNSSFYDYSNGLPNVVLGDEVAAEGNLFQNLILKHQRAFSWADEIYDYNETAIDIQNQLSNLYACNKIINEVAIAADGTELKKTSLRAEALATRALIYFQFINLYGKPYAAATAATDPGFPIILKADASEDSFPRKTVQEVYNLMIKDLQEAIPDLPTDNGLKTRMTRSAARGILGKVYLFMGKYPESLVQLNEAFADLALSSSPAALYDYNVTFATGGAFLPITSAGPAYPGNRKTDVKETLLLKTSNAGTYNGNGFGNNGMIITKETMALYLSSDFRLKFYSGTHADNTVIPGGNVRKYALNVARIGLELPDLILMRAEARARTSDLPGAKQDVELLRKNRMPVADAVVPLIIAGDQTALIRFIIDERRREFAGEGYRWLDMRRLSADPVFSSKVYTHTVFAADGLTPTSTYTLKPERFVLRIPQALINANPTQYIMKIF